jgi:hypothetical protein
VKFACRRSKRNSWKLIEIIRNLKNPEIKFEFHPGSSSLLVEKTGDK